MIYSDEENYPKAIEFFGESLNISRQMNRQADIAASLLSIAHALSESGTYCHSLSTNYEKAKAMPWNSTIRENCSAIFTNAVCRCLMIKWAECRKKSCAYFLSITGHFTKRYSVMRSGPRKEKPKDR